MFARRCSFALGLVLLAALPCLGGEPKGKFTVVGIPVSGTDAALHPESGTLAVLCGDRPQVVLYPDFVNKRQVEDSKTIDIGVKASDILFKKVGARNFYVLLASDSDTMIVLDADRGEVLKKIALPLGNRRGLTASRNPRDPHVYYCGGGGHDCRLGRVNLETLTSDGILEGTDTVMMATISADGSMLYTHGPWSPSGFRAVALDRTPDGKFSLKGRQLHYDHTSVGYYLPDPFGQYVLTDRRVCSPDLKRTLANIKFTPHWISEALPLLVCYEANRLAVVSTNNFEEIGAIDLPATFRKRDDGFAPRLQPGPRLRILEQPSSQTLLLCRGTEVALLSLKDADLPREPFLAVTLDSPAFLMVGQSYALPLQLRDPAVKVELKDGPKGVKLAQGKLHWAPEGSDVGTHTIQLQLSAGKLAVTRDVTLAVKRPSMDLGFAMRRLAVAPDAATAVVLGPDGQAEPQRDPFRDGEQLTRLVLLDLNGMAKVTERKLLVPVSSIAIDEHYVYAAAARSDVFYVLNRKDLSDVKRIFTNGQVLSLTSVGGKLLFVRTQSNQLMVLNLPDLKTAEQAEVGVGIHLAAKGESRTKQPPVQVGRSWWYDGCLYEKSLSKLLQLGQPPWVLTNPRAAVFEHDLDDPRMAQLNPQLLVPTWLRPWGVSVDHQGVRQGKRLIQIGGRPSHDQPGSNTQMLLSEQPALVALRVSLTQGGQNNRIKTALQFYDLNAGALQLELVLNEEPFAEQHRMLLDRFGGGGGLQLLERAGKLIAASGSNLYVVSLPALDADKFQAPMYFQPSQDMVVLDDKQGTMSVPKLVGGKAPYEVTFRRDVPGVDIDAKNGKLLLDRERLTAHACSTLLASYSQVRGPDSKGGAAEALGDYARTVAPLFERVTGRKTKQVPFWLSFGLVARDDNLQSAETDVGLFIEVPLDELQAKLKAVRVQAPPEPEPVFNPKEFTPEALLQAHQQLQRRVMRLERQLTELQETLDRLNKLLDKK